MPLNDVTAHMAKGKGIPPSELGKSHSLPNGRKWASMEGVGVMVSIEDLGRSVTRASPHNTG